VYVGAQNDPRVVLRAGSNGIGGGEGPRVSLWRPTLPPPPLNLEITCRLPCSYHIQATLQLPHPGYPAAVTCRPPCSCHMSVTLQLPHVGYPAAATCRLPCSCHIQATLQLPHVGYPAAAAPRLARLPTPCRDGVWVPGRPCSRTRWPGKIPISQDPPPPAAPPRLGYPVAVSDP
jgi:hypothetical protein